MASRVYKSALLEMEAIVGPRNLWPENIRRIILSKHSESNDQIVQLCAFAYINFVDPYLLENVLCQVGGTTAYADYKSAIHASYFAWNMSKDLRRSQFAYSVKKRSMLNLNNEEARKVGISPMKSPAKSTYQYSPSKSTYQYSPSKSTYQYSPTMKRSHSEASSSIKEEDIDIIFSQIPESLLDSPNKKSKEIAVFDLSEEDSPKPKKIDSCENKDKKTNNKKTAMSSEKKETSLNKEEKISSNNEDKISFFEMNESLSKKEVNLSGQSKSEDPE